LPWILINMTTLRSSGTADNDIKLKECIIRKERIQYVKNFILKHHYSKCTSSAMFWFGFYFKNRLIGVASFGHPTGKRQRKYYYPENPMKLLELRRLCLIDETPKNAESRFISLCIKYLRDNTDYEAILSLADPFVGHTGIIYKASNFEYLGKTAVPGNPIYIIDGKQEHPRNLYAKHGTSAKEIIKKIYGDRVKIEKRTPKLAYIYRIKRKKLRVNNRKKINGFGQLKLFM